MILLYDLPALLRTIMLCLVFLILWLTMMLLAESVYQRMYRGFSVFFFLIVIVNYIFFELCLDEKYRMNIWVVTAYIAAMILFDIFIIRKGIKYRQENFTVISVKQGLDAMEEGICFYTENGLPQFTNKYMNDVSLAISGRTIVDASGFWKDLRDGNIKPDCKIITSIQNPKINQRLLLQQKCSERRKTGLFVVEGRRELMHCMEAGYQLDTVFFCDQIEAGTEPMPQFPDDVRLFEVSKDVYEKMAYRGSTEGVIAAVRSRQWALHDLPLGTHPLIVVVERVEKPGNLGAILRSADAAGVDAVIVCDPLTDLYNPNLIRSSVGGFFSVPCIACSSEECIAFLKSKGIRILTAQLQDSRLYYDTDMTLGTAIVMGTESTGLTQVWRDVADAHIRIPMLGKIDSLNVSVSAAVLMFEAVRQRSAPNV